MACSVEDLCRTSVARVCNARGFPREYFINENTKNRRVFIRSMCKTLACTLYFFIYFIFLLLLLVCARIHYCDRETNCVFWEIIIDYCAGQKLNRTPLKPCNNIRKAYTHTLTFVYAIKKKNTCKFHRKPPLRYRLKKLVWTKSSAISQSRILSLNCLW